MHALAVDSASHVEDGEARPKIHCYCDRLAVMVWVLLFFKPIADAWKAYDFQLSSYKSMLQA